MGERRDGEVAAARASAPTPGRQQHASAPGRQQKKSEVVARQLIERIVDDGLGSGDRLEHEGELIDRLGVSRATLREAFRLLEVTGILRVRPGREGGAIVQQPTGEDFGRMVTLFFQVSRCTYRQLLGAAIVIQPAIYRQAALEADDDDRKRLRELWDEPEGRARDDNDDVRSLTGLFRVVADATHNPVLKLIVAAIGAVFQRHMDRLLVGIPHRREGARVGRLLVEAIENGDGERAARLIRAHLEGWLEIAERQYPHILDAVVNWDQ